MEKTKRYSFIIDPHMQATTWLKKQYEESGMLVTKLNDPIFKRSLELALEMGKRVMVEGIEDEIDI